MIRHELNPDLINRVANTAAVRPFVDYRDDVSTPLDFAVAVGPVDQTGVIFLSNGRDAVAAFALTDVREWQAHVMYGEQCRGRRAIDTAREMLEWMRPHADVIWGSVPARNRRALWFARQMGFHPLRGDVFDKEGPVDIVVRGEASPRFGFILQNEVVH